MDDHSRQPGDCERYDPNSPGSGKNGTLVDGAETGRPLAGRTIAGMAAEWVSVGGVMNVALVTIFAGGLWRRGGIGSTGGLFRFSFPVDGSGGFGQLEQYIAGFRYQR